MKKINVIIYRYNKAPLIESLQTSTEHTLQSKNRNERLAEMRGVCDLREFFLKRIRLCITKHKVKHIQNPFFVRRASLFQNLQTIEHFFILD